MPNTVALLYDPLLHVGSIEIHLLSLLRYGARARYRWLIVALINSAFQAQADDLVAQVFPWRVTHQLDIAALARLVYLLRYHHIDLVHAHSPRAALLGWVADRPPGLCSAQPWLAHSANADLGLPRALVEVW